MSEQLEQLELKPQIREFVDRANLEEWQKLNIDQRAQIITALQRFGVIDHVKIIGLTWMLDCKALNIVEEQRLQSTITSLRDAVRVKIDKLKKPQIPDLELPPPPPRKPNPQLMRTTERPLDPLEMAHRFQKRGINLFTLREAWSNFYLQSGYWHSGREKTTPLPIISEKSMQQFEEALKSGVIDCIALDDGRLGDGQALHRLTGLHKSNIPELDKSVSANNTQIRQLLEANQPQLKIAQTKRDKKDFRKAKRETEQTIITNAQENNKGKDRRVRLIGFSIEGNNQLNIQYAIQQLKQPGWSAMSIGTINRVLSYLYSQDPSSAYDFLEKHPHAMFANNFTTEGRCVGFEIIHPPSVDVPIATPHMYRSIFTINGQTPFIPVLVGSAK